MGSSEPQPPSVLRRAFGILDVLERADAPVGLSEIACRSGIPKATTYRLLKQLADLGTVARRGELYGLGFRLAALGSAVSTHRRLREAALPYMMELCVLPGQAVHLGVLDGSASLNIEKAVRGFVERRGTVGLRRPLHATALGKAILAELPEERSALLLAGPLERCTPQTLVRPGMLARQLRETRLTGLAYEREEWDLGFHSVAAPIGTGPEGIVAAISVLGRTTRFRLESPAPALREAALGIARACGFSSMAGTAPAAGTAS